MFLKKPHLWCFSVYFAEGLPFSIIRTISSVFFRDMNVSLESIGLTSFFGLPWILKFLWAPQIDEFSTKRKWLLVNQILLAVLFALAAVIAPLPFGVKAISVLFLIGSVLAATHDVAIDGYYLEALSKEDQAKFVGYRVMAYRIAMMTGTGVIVTIGAMYGWFYAFISGAILLALLFAYHNYGLPVCETQKKPAKELLKYFLTLKVLSGSGLLFGIIAGIWFFVNSDFYIAAKSHYAIIKELNFAAYIGILLLISLVLLALARNKIKERILKNPGSFYSKSFITFMDQENIALLLMFIIFLRTGEFLLSSMVSPFMVDLGLKVHYGWISGGVGLPCSIFGAVLGGWMISRYTLKKVLWPFLLLQNLTNVVYMAPALSLADFLTLNTGNQNPVSIGLLNLIYIAGVHGFDQIASGLGSAVLVTFLMRICKAEYRASHYAIGSGLMSVSGLFTGVVSGFLAKWMGYGYFFGFSFILSVPGMILAYYVARASDNK